MALNEVKTGKETLGYLKRPVKLYAFCTDALKTEWGMEKDLRDWETGLLMKSEIEEISYEKEKHSDYTSERWE